MSQPSNEIIYRLGTGSVTDSLHCAFSAVEAGTSRTWQMRAEMRGRGGKVRALFVQTTALRPLATVTIKGQNYPLTIGWHERRRGGIICFGGERRLGTDGGMLSWEMRWTANKAQPGGVKIEMRLRSTPRCCGDLRVSLHTPLHAPTVWSLDAAEKRGHCAQSVSSAYSGHAVLFTALASDAGWNAAQSAFEVTLPRFPFGGGKLVRFDLGLLPETGPNGGQGALVMQYTSLAAGALHPLTDLPAWSPARAATRLLDPKNIAVQGAERVYLRQGDCADTFYAGYPHYPLEALAALWDWNRIAPSELAPRLVRYGAGGIAADFQVMGRGAGREPNKGAFWDKRTGGTGTDFCGEATHGIASNARIAGALFRLHEATGDPLLRQSALNICQWLILKMDCDGAFAGDRTFATRGLPDDGRMTGPADTLAGMTAIRPLVQAFRATRNEVFITTARKVADMFLARRAGDHASTSAPAVAEVLLGLLALDAEAPNPRLHAVIRAWASWLRALPLDTADPNVNADGRHSELYDCAQAGFALHAFLRDPAFLQYAWAAINRIPPESRACAWRELALFPPALLSIAALLPDAHVDFSALSVTLGWRTFAPDPATSTFLQARSASGEPLHCLPLVSPHDDYLLLLVLAPSAVEHISVFKNGRRPLMRDLLTGALDTGAPLQPLNGERWARVGIFTIAP